MIFRIDARTTYQLPGEFFDRHKRPILGSFHAARELSHRVNQQRDTIADPESLIKASELYGLSLIDRLSGILIKEALENRSLEGVGKEEERELTSLFLQSHGEGREKAPFFPEICCDLIRLRVSNENPLAAPLEELIDDRELEAAKALERLLSSAADIQLEGSGLLDILRMPFQLHPDSVAAQLRFIRSSWPLPEGEFDLEILSALDFLSEEERPFFGGGPGPQLPYVFDTEEQEGFSPDTEWMPLTVMLAKNVLVWMDQLARKYDSTIETLDQIPGAELDRIAGMGFSSLWLIGLWRRSPASKRIKHLCGNTEAEASAYSLAAYEIAPELGGDKALERLRIEAAKRGIRLASDMVPNHTGIDSDWIYDHPDYFLQVPVSPYPAYSYTGENLSRREGYGTYLEDHYLDRSDAAVVFKHVEETTGRERFIYHGNDGTHMPWNDTAQLNYLNPEVREAVIQTIIGVAKQFPIIRFDAAMTLAKQHIRRLWYPSPGQGGAVPSRAEHAISEQSFDRALPKEFFREVVDRVAEEAPGTLLLAEAFWMMEGYFVRSLGMHRVYNSAFMNMLKSEENDKYRETIRNTLEFDREILKRFVNFMNNPDEETAFAQFGGGDKYFGVCTMLATMPGLPMFGHGQIEGLKEKYGMEYRTALIEEQADPEIEARHKREIVPLLRKRALFAGAENFTLFDFVTPAGVNQNVFAYANRSGDETVLVLYNNALESAKGTIRSSVPYRDKQRGGNLHQRNLGEALDVPDNPRSWLIMRQHQNGLEFIRNCREIARYGLNADLPGYGTQLYWEMRVVADDAEGRYRSLAEELAGAGCRNIDGEIRRLHMRPLHKTLSEVLSPARIERLREALYKGAPLPDEFFGDLETGYRRFLQQAAEEFPPTAMPADREVLVNRTVAESLKQIVRIASLDLAADAEEEGIAGPRGYLQRGLEMRSDAALILTAWTLIEHIGATFGKPGEPEYSSTLIDEWHLGAALRDIFQEAGLSDEKANYGVELIKLLTSFQDWEEEVAEDEGNTFLITALHREELQRFLLVNRYNDVLWFNKDRFEDLLWWLFCIAVLRMPTSEEGAEREMQLFERITAWLTIEETSAYRMLKLIELLETEA